MFLGSIMGSETTAAAAGTVGELRCDPFAMLPFCGYNMADYFAHWLAIGETADGAKLPKIFYVNWFRKDDDGKFLWPGFGENSRVLAWVFAPLRRRRRRRSTPRSAASRAAGVARDRRPRPVATPTSPSCCASTRRAGRPSSRRSTSTSRRFDRLPDALREQLDALEKRLS